MDDEMSTFNFGEFNEIEVKTSEATRLNKMIEYAKGIDRSSNPDEAAHYHRKSEELLESYNFFNMNMAKESNVLPFLVASSVGFVSFLEKWKFHGLSFDVADYEGQTALHYVVWNPFRMRNLLNTVRFLLDNGANVNALSKNGENPLHTYGCGLNDDHIQDEYSSQIIVELVNAGADVHEVSEEGLTPLFVALERSVLAQNIEIMLNLGADLIYEYKSGENCFMKSLTWQLDLVSKEYHLERLEETLRKAEKAICHVTKMEIFGLHVSERVQSSFNELMEMIEYFRVVHPTDIRNHRLSKSCIDNFKKECELEKEKMKSSKLDGVYSMYDLAVKSEGELLGFTNKEVFRDYIKSNDYIKDFPIYWFVLRSQFRAAEDRRRLLPECMKHLKSYNFPLVDLCLHHILQQFTNDQLYKFALDHILYSLTNISFFD